MSCDPRSLFPALLLACAACVAAPEDEQPPEAPFVRGQAADPSEVLSTEHWSARFASEAVLVADRITIEGPDDLLSTCAVMQAPEVLESETRTTPEGLLQTIRVTSDGGGTVIRAQIGGWSVAAMSSMVVLQRPDQGATRIRAEGDASFIPVGGEGTRRGATLVFRSDDGTP